MNVHFYLYGTPVENSGHNTGGFVEPLQGGNFIPPSK